MAVYLENILNRMHIRTTDFFLKNYKKFNDDVDAQKVKGLSDIELQCLGYGIFNKKEVLNNFYRYTVDLLQRCNKEGAQVRSLKITLNGFQLQPQDRILVRIADRLTLIRENLKVLWIHTSNLKQCTLEDFDRFFSLCIDLTDINFEDFSLQCANWRFVKNQPRFRDLKQIFKSKIDRIDEIVKINNRFFRLQISGWYYDAEDAKAFLESNSQKPEQLAQDIEKFHIQMEKLVDNLLQGMDHIQQLELDMRNYHEILKMKNLKKRLDNVKKQNTYEKSIMSKRYDIQADETERELKLRIVM